MGISAKEEATRGSLSIEGKDESDWEFELETSKVIGLRK